MTRVANSDQVQQPIFPLYIVYGALDSSSCTDWTEQIRAGVLGFLDFVAMNPVLDSGIELALYEFGDSLQEVMPLSACPLGQLPNRWSSMKRFCNRVDYATVFSQLQVQVEYDLYLLRGEGRRVRRPMVILAIRSAPAAQDDWQSAYGRLVRSNPEMLEQQFAETPFLASICVSTEAEGFAAAVVNPRGVARAYRASSPSAIGDVISLVASAAIRQHPAASNTGVPWLPGPEQLPDTAVAIA